MQRGLCPLAEMVVSDTTHLAACPVWSLLPPCPAGPPPVFLCWPVVRLWLRLPPSRPVLLGVGRPVCASPSACSRRAGFPRVRSSVVCPAPGSGAVVLCAVRPCRGVPQGSAAAPLAGWRLRSKTEFLCHSAQLVLSASPAISAVSWALRRSRRTGLRSKPKSAPSRIRTVHPAALDPVMIHAAGTARARHAMRRIPA